MATTPTSESSLKTYVASKKGKKYHLPTCVGAKTISEANKVWFVTKADAEKAGYTPAGNCKGI
jgi:methylphosphotriester-DNA--protein-cysteine methyltransferase